MSEAFAMGVSVAALKIGEPAERITDGVGSLLATPGDVRAWQSTLRRLTTESQGCCRHCGRDSRAFSKSEYQVQRT